MSSWGEDLMRYKQAKLATPWDIPGAAQMNHLVKGADVAQKQRAFNPVLQRAVVTRDERRLQQQDQERARIQAERAMEKRLKQTHVSHDPVTNEIRYPTKEQAPKRQHIIADTRTDYNIVNFNDHFNKNRWNQFTKSKPADRGKKVEFPKELTYTKDFNIVSTKYNDRHDERVANQAAWALHSNTQEFHKRNKYNPVRGIFYDKKKEVAFRERRKEFMETHALRHELPESVKNTDGALYNILNNEVLNEDGLRQKEAYDNRSLETRKKKGEFEKLVKQRQSDEYELNLSRKLARVSHLRDQAQRERGYDPLTNQPFSGVGAKPLPPSQQKPKLSAWEQALAASSRVLGNNHQQERRGRAQTTGQRLLTGGGRASYSRATTGVPRQRQRTGTSSRPGGGGPGVPFIPKDRKMSNSRPRGQTGRINVK